jgi:hypothetical protein
LNYKDKHSKDFHISLPTNGKKFEKPREESIRYHDIGHKRDRRTQLDKIAEE